MFVGSYDLCRLAWITKYFLAIFKGSRTKSPWTKPPPRQNPPGQNPP